MDEFKVGKPAGFPDHPHRGFETVTYMLPTTKGSFAHEDFCGHHGVIGPGDLQRSGREDEENGVLEAYVPNEEASCAFFVCVVFVLFLCCFCFCVVFVLFLFVAKCDGVKCVFVFGFVFGVCKMSHFITWLYGTGILRNMRRTQALTM